MKKINLLKEIESLSLKSRTLENRSLSLIHNPQIIPYEMDCIIEKSIRIINKLDGKLSPEIEHVKSLLNQKNSPLHYIRANPTKEGIAGAGRFGQKLAGLFINHIESK
ncbi:hypothetical protein VB319_21985 [Vibrio parahaemolyticus]|uniref:hypothetical protein n=1 Tax=Vibrio parahaemolyticus TaxID=670 RepID=UPI002B216D15|nr:hypothetical protein [Vibrio parahaemolyticus]MEA5356651.1 hypothetical protein [Vibrio parahaemolyticus]